LFQRHDDGAIISPTLPQMRHDILLFMRGAHEEKRSYMLRVAALFSSSRVRHVIAAAVYATPGCFLLRRAA